MKQGEWVRLGHEGSSMRIINQDGYKVVIFEGELDFFNDPMVDLNPFCTEDLILDFQGVTFVDCSWIWKLLRYYRNLAENGRRLIIIKSSHGLSAIEHILEHAGLMDYFVLHTDHDSALASLA